MRDSAEQDIRVSAVRKVRETGKTIAQVARELDVDFDAVMGWVAEDRQTHDAALTDNERAELIRLRAENAELRMQRDLLKRSVVFWVNEATGR